MAIMKCGAIYILSILSVFCGVTKAMAEQAEIAVFGAGCFWCVEAVFEGFKGVSAVEAGYAGGHTQNPTYEQVSDGDTGHAEVAHITFDPRIITYAELLEVFFHTHDPTTRNQQGADHGPQYRSIVLYMNDVQKETVLAVKKKVEAEKLWPNPIVTEIEPLTKYYPAENYHQDYYQNNKSKPYCSLVIGPKLQKLRKRFAEKLKIS
jgi:peptide-methionine (S)-S-oxide reductase